MSDVKVLFQGDSITDCCRNREITKSNVELGNGYAMLVAARLLAKYPDKNYSIYNRGISGNRIVDLYARWKEDCLNMKPDVLSILIGINDIWKDKDPTRLSGVELSRYERIYQELLEWTVETLPEIKIVLCEPFALPFGVVTEKWLPDLKKRRAIVERLATDFKATFVPFQRVFDIAVKQKESSYWLVDGVHPTYAGHSLMSDIWLEKVLPVLV